MADRRASASSADGVSSPAPLIPLARARVALVGLGNAGFTIHLPALAGISGAVVVGASDIDASRRDRAAARWRVPVFGDLEELLDQTRPNVVIVGTPPALHAQQCLLSFAAGADVICEKPFASSVAEAERVLEAARASGRRIAMNHEFREMPIFRAVLDAAMDSSAGRPVFAQLWQLMDLPPWAEPGWRGRLLQGTLYEAGVHLVDYAMALFREKPRAVSATVSTCGVRDERSDAVALVTLEFSDGRLAHIVQNRLCKGETQYFEARVETERTSLRASFGGRARVSAGLHRSTRPHVRLEYGVSGMAWREVAHERSLLARNPKDPAMVATRILFRKTLAAFRSGSEPPATGEDGRDVLEVIAACYRSAETGRRVTLDRAMAAELKEVELAVPA